MKRSLLIAAALAFATAACFGSDANLTAKGLSRPVLDLTFPKQADPRSTQEAVLRITNPGPGDMATVLVSFSALGHPSLPRAIVGTGSSGSNPAVVSVEPSPDAVSQDGVVYRFDGLAAGESTTVTFALRVPPHPGVAANSVIVYAGEDIARARGICLETIVGEYRGGSVCGPQEART